MNRRLIGTLSLAAGLGGALVALAAPPPVHPPKLPRVVVPRVATPAVHAVKGHVDFEIEADDLTKFRVTRPPARLDEKGKPTKYTSQELKELRGPDDKLPGFPASYNDLAVGQTVKVTLVKPKSDEKKKDDKKADEKKADGDKKPDAFPYDEMTGRIVRVDGGSTMTFVVRVDYATLAAGRGHRSYAPSEGDVKEFPVDRHAATVLVQPVEETKEKPK